MSREESPSIPPFNEFLGTRLVSRGDGTSVLELELGPHHRNNRGVAHGGVISALLDSALGSAVISAMEPQEWCGTLQLTVTFIEGPRQGTLRATGRVVRRGRRVAFAEGTLTHGDGRTLATAQGVWYIWPRRPEGGDPPRSED